MTQSQRLEILTSASPEAVFAAVTDNTALETWFCEHADVDLLQHHYDFWGRFTPESPERESGRHEVVSHEQGGTLRWNWLLRGFDSEVTYTIQPKGENTRFTVLHEGLPDEEFEAFHITNFWRLSLENLQAYLANRPNLVRCDFSAIEPGDFEITIEVDAPPESVFEILITPDQLDRWISRHASLEPQAGGEISFGWMGIGPVKILDIEHGRRVSYSWQIRPDSERESIVTWELEGSEGKTRLTMFHHGFAPDEDTEGYQLGWVLYCNRIRFIVEAAHAWQRPFSDPEREH